VRRGKRKNLKIKYLFHSNLGVVFSYATRGLIVVSLRLIRFLYICGSQLIQPGKKSIWIYFNLAGYEGPAQFFLNLVQLLRQLLGFLRILKTQGRIIKRFLEVRNTGGLDIECFGRLLNVLQYHLVFIGELRELGAFEEKL
jgi:hypothetical protein